jgi:hypothetical protein
MELQLKHGVVRVDDEDADLVRPFRWYSVRVVRATTFYAMAKIAGRTVYMHRLILNAPKGRQVDHRNGDGLDNRRANLRLATSQQNAANTRSHRGSSQFKGVSWSQRAKVWQAHIMFDGCSFFLGYYQAEEDAARAYDLAAVANFGPEFAHVNLSERFFEPPPVPFSIRASRARTIPDPTATAPPEIIGKRRPGVRNANAKLTEAEVRQIIAALQAVPRRTQTDIAREFGVAQAHISRIAQRKNWAYLWPT